MALFGSTNAYLGLDIGSSALKVVELVNRRKRVELATYGQANLGNILIAPNAGRDAVRKVANVILQLMDKAGVSTDTVIAALPSSVVFSTVLTLPQLSEADLEHAVRFAARDVVPADLNDTVLGWSRITSPITAASADTKPAVSPIMKVNGSTVAPLLPTETVAGSQITENNSISVFLTAAPKDIVARYVEVMELTKLDLVALEVESFALVRSLLNSGHDSALVADIGNKVTTFHIIDGGASRASSSVEFGGRNITQMLVDNLNLSYADAEAKKIAFGLSSEAPANIRVVFDRAMRQLFEPAQQMLARYTFQYQRKIPKAILIGGGANMRDLPRAWSEAVGLPASCGNPWKGLALPNLLESKLTELGPNFAVAVGLAERQFSGV